MTRRLLSGLLLLVAALVLGARDVGVEGSLA